jgi:LysR family transcriptional regulator, benzoate and cis,cis-muconate-responsive activator of ben and cat genes
MELRHFRYFVAVAEEESVTRAAARLHVSQPPLSRQIRDLEREMDVALFERTSKGVRLTEAGRVFLVEARGLLQRADEAVERAKAYGLGRRGNVRVGHASPTIDILRRALRSFWRTYPEVTVDLLAMTSQGMLRGLRECTLDVALTVSIAPRDFDGLAVEHLGAYAVRVAMSRKHRFAKLREVPLRDIAAEPIVAFTRSEHPEAYAGVLQILAPFTRSPNIVDEHDSFANLITAVEAGRGVALVSNNMSVISGERLVMRPLKPAPPSLPIAMAYRKEELSAAAAAFIAATRAAKPKHARPSGPVLTA